MDSIKYSNQNNQPIRDSSKKRIIPLISALVVIALVIISILFFGFFDGAKTENLNEYGSEITKEDLIQGIIVDLKEGEGIWWLDINEDNWRHAIVFDKVYPKEEYYSKVYEDDSDVADFDIGSSRIYPDSQGNYGGGSWRLSNIHLAVDEEEKFDYKRAIEYSIKDGSHIYDLKIKLISLSNNTAKIYLKKINERYCDCLVNDSCNPETGKCVDCIVTTDCATETELCFGNYCQTAVETINKYTQCGLGESSICNNISCENCRKGYCKCTGIAKLDVCVECSEDKECKNAYKCENHECIPK